MARHDDDVDSLDELAALQGFGDLRAEDLVDVEQTSGLSLDAREFVDDDDDDDREIDDVDSVDSLEELEEFFDDPDYGDPDDWLEWDVESSADYEET